ELSKGSGEGTFQLGSRDLILTPSSGKDKGTAITRSYLTEGGYLWIKFREFENFQLPFAKQKLQEATTTTTASGNATAAAPATTVAPANRGRRTNTPAQTQGFERERRTGILPRGHRGGNN